MYINKLIIKNIRSISSFEMTFDQPAGWHVIIGDNGAGKSSIVRAVSLGIIGPDDARALRLNLNDWVRRDTNEPSSILLEVLKHEQDKKKGQSNPRTRPFDVKLTLGPNENNGYEFQCNEGKKAAFENIWSNASGWFSCAFGPFRRFTGGEKEWMKVYYSDPRAAAHLSVFGEDVALTEAIDWLKSLHVKTLEQSSNLESASILTSLKSFLNEGGLLPHGTKLDSISSEGVFFIDGNQVKVEVSQMSDGYRSILSLTFELIRQMVRSYGHIPVFANFQNNNFIIDLPGVVLIDEIDAHLHPTWQVRIGEWFLKIFPKLQFIVTTHSPLICRAAENGSIWKLQTPGSEYPPCEVTGIEKDRLILGDLLDAYGTELFGRDITQSESGQEISERLGQLNMKSFQAELTHEEQAELNRLQNITSNISNAPSN